MVVWMGNHPTDIKSIVIPLNGYNTDNPAFDSVPVKNLATVLNRLRSISKCGDSGKTDQLGLLAIGCLLDRQDLPNNFDIV